jgi:hypothetical protein
MANTLKFGNGQWAVKEGSTLAYNDENNNFKPLPFNFERDSRATVVNKDGLIETVGSGEPRIDFSNDVKGALLLEPSRTNIAQRTEEFDNSYWTKTRTVVTANQTVSPNGNQTADKYILNCTSNRSQMTRILYSVGTQYTTSLFVKYDSVKYFYISNAGASAYRTVFDIENGTIISTGSSVDSSKIENYGNGWYRCSATFIAAYTTLYYNLSPNSNNATFTNTTDFSYIWGAQVEQASYATSHIPTQGSAVTRLADICNGAGNDQVFNDSEGVIYVETQPFIDGDFTSVYISLSDNTTGGNFITIQHRNSGQLRVYAGNFSTIIFLQNIDMSENLKIALQYENITDFKLYVNGISYPIYSTPTNSAFVGLNTFDFKLRGSASGYWLGQVKEAKYFNTALTDTELAALTS